MDTQIVVYPYNGTSLSNKNKSTHMYQLEILNYINQARKSKSSLNYWKIQPYSFILALMDVTWTVYVGKVSAIELYLQPYLVL